MAVDLNAAVAGQSARLMSTARQEQAPRPAPEGPADGDDVLEQGAGRQGQGQMKAMEMADDLANIAAQFRNRRELEKKAPAAEEGFERVLEEDVEAKAQQLLQASSVRELSMRSLLAQAKSLFPDESDLYLVLGQLCLRAQLAEAQRERLAALRQQLLQQSSERDLRGGVHCALKAKLFGRSLSVKATLLRQTYRRFLSRQREPLDHYEDWIASYGHKARHTVLDFVEESLACDIRSADPSCSLLEFDDLLGQMNKLRALRSADLEFVVGMVTRRIASTDDDEAYWILTLCALLRLEDDHAAVLSELMVQGGVLTPVARSQWLNAVRAACKLLPSGLCEAIMPDLLASAFDGLISAQQIAELPARGQPC